MGFISFHEDYYRERLSRFEAKTLTEAELYEAKQLLKLLDDLTDEGYTTLNERMEEDFSCLSRLRALIREAGEEPFAIEPALRGEVVYGSREWEVSELADRLIERAREGKGVSENPFLGEIIRYCQWIGREEDTATVFLLRDALLPYVYFRSRGAKHVIPWLISRSFLCDLAGVRDADDDIRFPIYCALEEGVTAFPAFSSRCRREMLTVLEGFPRLKEALQSLLASIPERRIMVVESGYCGTVPLLLSALDERVSFRMFTTAPYLCETYREQVFCPRYEDVRRFETIYSQDALLRYSSYRDGKFYVTMTDDEEITERSFAEIRAFLGE